jgi:hypothetical protein
MIDPDNRLNHSLGQRTESNWSKTARNRPNPDCHRGLAPLLRPALRTHETSVNNIKLRTRK